MSLFDFRRPLAHKQIPFAESAQTEQRREAIDAFLHRVLPADEREFIDSYFISDEASIFDCSMAMPQDWIANCQKEYGITLSQQEFKMPLYLLVEHVNGLLKT